MKPVGEVRLMSFFSCRVTFRSPLEMVLGQVSRVAPGLQSCGGGAQAANGPFCSCPDSTSLLYTYSKQHLSLLLSGLYPSNFMSYITKQEGSELISEPRCRVPIPQPSAPLHLARLCTSNGRVSRSGCASSTAVPRLLQTGRMRVLLLVSLNSR